VLLQVDDIKQVKAHKAELLRDLAL